LSMSRVYLKYLLQNSLCTIQIYGKYMEIYKEKISVKSTQTHVFTIATHTMKYDMIYIIRSFQQKLSVNVIIHDIPDDYDFLILMTSILFRSDKVI